MAGAEPFENPLIPNARLKGIYLAMLRARRLEEALPAKQRAWTVGLEACLVAPAMDLVPGDLISDAIGGATIRFLRGESLGQVLRPGKRARTAVHAEAGAGVALPAPGSAPERLWAALGAAAALRANRKIGESDATAAGGTGVVLVFLRSGEVAAGVRRSVFEFAAEHSLPAVFAILPAAKHGPAGANAAQPAAKAGIPVIPVDRDDAVAIYRVAQESFGRARMGGGPAVIECVPFVPKQQRGAGETRDALRNIERYILERSIATPEWMERESRVLARQLDGPVH